MITGVRVSGTAEKGKFEFTGLSTDTKPTETYKGTIIENENNENIVDKTTNTIFIVTLPQ